jgi:hypothetical protein
MIEDALVGIHNKLIKLLSIKKHALAGHQWLTSIILATQESEIRRIAVQS